MQTMLYELSISVIGILACNQIAKLDLESITHFRLFWENIYILKPLSQTHTMTAHYCQAFLHHFQALAILNQTLSTSNPPAPLHMSLLSGH